MGTKIIDFHTHILPGIDDGSRDIDTSCRMLEMAAEQGVELIVATPHFYASRDRIEHFLEKREHARNILSDKLQNYPLQIRPFSMGSAEQGSWTA